MNNRKQEENEKPVLSIRNISKFFGHIKALENINYDFYKSEIVAIVGDNGAGKSTLLKILSGAQKPTQGLIKIGNKTISYLTPAKAISHGIVTVYQDLALVNCRDIVSNIFLGNEIIKTYIFIDKNTMKKQALELIKRLNINIPDINVLVGDLSGGQRQALAIARAINQGGKIIILDEPTAAMGLKESMQIVKLMKKLREDGYTVIVISHNMHQVFSISDRICVMRQGKMMAELNTKETTPNEVVKIITGIVEEDLSVS